ncbi:XrtA/PEP-CTERM system exopolysaccharide export protein [Wenzhouxiangella sp. EGI_FJ10305]|uniref:XrtA/PEP-CTERM system exopolysaccharide export protein n=1 Tax=Wenzhouxiangella sp. EGI_FJ10305 TaxID=3243768 RepID=UPI0035E2E06C
MLHSSYSRLLVPFSLAILMVLGGCAGQSTKNSAPSVETAMPAEDYLIGVDDMIEVSVWNHPDLGVTVPVRADGMITIPLIGDVQAGGRRPTDVAAEASQALEEFVHEPQVTVIVAELRSHEYLSRVRVTGAVRTPVSLPHRQGMTVLDAILAAGGPNEFAAANRSSLHRQTGNGSFATYDLPLQRMLEEGDLSANHLLAPGDVVVVPQRLF